jgi:phage shock protein PspC (stress-responsive transcriptional regulator)
MGKRLYRSTSDRKIAGVCGGIAEYFDIDSTWVRIIFLILLFLGLFGLLLYLIFWICAPKGPQPG